MLDLADLAQEVHVWYSPTSTFSNADLENHAATVLSEEERNRAERFAFPNGQRSYIAAHWLLRNALSRYAPGLPKDWEFACTPRGKPFLCAPHKDLGLYFNLSHTKGMVACAITRVGEVGVDVETVRPREYLDLARRYFAPSEVAQLESLSREKRRHAFFRLWTLKEAYIKAQGLGLAMDLASFAFPGVQDDEIKIEFAQGVEDSSAGWRFFRHEPDPEHKIAVAVNCRSEIPPRFRIFDMFPTGESSKSFLE